MGASLHPIIKGHFHGFEAHYVTKTKLKRQKSAGKALLTAFRGERPCVI
jgi:hypothetical protein